MKKFYFLVVPFLLQHIRITYSFLNFKNILPYQYLQNQHYTTNRKNTLKAKKHSSSGSDIKYMSPLYKPKTENQAFYVEHLNNVSIPIVIGVGPAGSGKTLFACNQAVMALKQGLVQKIIMTRPVVPVEEDIGFLPGSLIHKMDPWTRPIFDILLEYYNQKDIDSMLHSGILEISPLAYMRGRTFKKAFIIADEMQNSSPNQMLMLTTRIGDNSKMVITGDLKQSDRGIDNGLADFMRKIRKYENFCLQNNMNIPNIRLVEMAGTDIQRSPIVAKLLDIYSTDNYEFKNLPPSSSLTNNDKTIQDESSQIKKNVKKVVKDAILKNELMSRNNDAALVPIEQNKSSFYPWKPKPI